nr:hypothetical protein Iba_chr12fCG14580 [Ipomoea batatas]
MQTLNPVLCIFFFSKKAGSEVSSLNAWHATVVPGPSLRKLPADAEQHCRICPLLLEAFVIMRKAICLPLGEVHMPTALCRPSIGTEVEKGEHLSPPEFDFKPTN